VLTNFPGAIPNTDDYLAIVAYNSEQLLTALQTYRGNAP